MGYTTDPNGNAHSLFASLAQTAVQKFFHNVYLARPHYFNYASAGLGGGSMDIGLLPALAIPGSPSSVDLSIKFGEPILSFFPSPGFPAPPGPIAVDQFGLELKFT